MRNAHARETMRVLRNKQQRRLVCLGSKPHVDEKSGKKSPKKITDFFFRIRRCCLFPFPPPTPVYASPPNLLVACFARFGSERVSQDSHGFGRNKSRAKAILFTRKIGVPPVWLKVSEATASFCQCALVNPRDEQVMVLNLENVASYTHNIQLGAQSRC